MMTNSVNKAWLEADRALEARYPILYLATDDYAQVEQIMERSFFARHHRAHTPDAYTLGEPSREYIRLSEELSDAHFQGLVTGASVTREFLEDLNRMEQAAKEALHHCEMELSDPQAAGAVQEAIQSLRRMNKLAGAMNQRHAARRRVYYISPDGEAAGHFAPRTVALMEQYVEMWKRAWRSAEKPGGSPDQLPQTCLVIYGTLASIPQSLDADVYRVELTPLEEGDFEGILHTFGVTDRGVVRWYADWLAGYTEGEVCSILRELQAQGGVPALMALETTAKPVIERKNRERLLRHGKLKYEKILGLPSPKGVDNVLQWIRDHKESIRSCRTQNPDEITKGMLLVGVPGTGKSLLSKQAAVELDLPLYSFEISDVLGKYLGEAEQNMKELMEDVKRAAPCVLRIDEVEKALAGANGDDGSGGVFRRLFGQLLDFMEEMSRPVFVVAAANDVTAFPPEFKRNGRFDVRFAMGQPDYDGCIQIMKQKLDRFLGCGEDEELAKYLFDLCWQDGEQCCFLTGADINTVVKELKIKMGERRLDRAVSREEYEQLGQLLSSALQTITMSVETSRPQTVQDVALRYCRIMDLAAIMAGSDQKELLFSARRYHPQRITDYDGTGAACLTCIDEPGDLAERPIYDQKLFAAVRDGMDKLLSAELRRNDGKMYQLYLKKRNEQRKK